MIPMADNFNHHSIDICHELINVHLHVEEEHFAENPD